MDSLVAALKLLSSTINGLKSAVDSAASFPGNAKNAVVGAVGNVKDKGGDAMAAGMVAVHRAIGAVRKKPIDSGGGSEGGP